MSRRDAERPLPAAAPSHTIFYVENGSFIFRTERTHILEIITYFIRIEIL